MAEIKRAVVTGGGGFIASHLIRALVNRGVKVCALLRSDNVARNPRLADVWGDIWRVEADIRHRDEIMKIGGTKPDVVFHLAAFHHVGQSWRRVEECFEVNAMGSANVMDVVNGSARVVYMSTSEVYGRQKSVPWTEDLTPQPNSPYAVTKYAGELHGQMLRRLGHPVVLVRPFNTFGPAQSTRAVIPELIVKMLHGLTIETTAGEQTREFVYVDDTVEGLIAAAEAEEIPDGPVNIAGGKEVEVRSLVKVLHRLTESKGELKIGALDYRPNEVWRMLADTAKAEKFFGWKARATFEDAMAYTVQWYKDNLKAVS